MKAIKAKRPTKSVGEYSGRATVAAASPSTSPAAAPAGRQTAGFIFPSISPLGLLLLQAGWQPQSTVARRALKLARQAKTLSQLFRAQALLRQVIGKLQRRLRYLLRRIRAPRRPIVRKPIVLKHIAPQANLRHRAPPSQRRKARNEDAEGDADSHADFWFATVKPRSERAPTFALPAWRGG